MTLEKRAREEKRNAKRRAKEERRRDRRSAPRSGPEIVSAADIIGDNVRSIEEVMVDLELGPQENRSAPAIPTKLFVGSLSDSTTSSSLRAHFAEYGPIVEAVVILDRATRASRNFGFVTMADRKDAATAIDALHRSELDGKQIVVSVATER